MGKVGEMYQTELTRKFGITRDVIEKHTQVVWDKIESKISDDEYGESATIEVVSDFQEPALVAKIGFNYDYSGNVSDVHVEAFWSTEEEELKDEQFARYLELQLSN